MDIRSLLHLTESGAPATPSEPSQRRISAVFEKSLKETQLWCSLQPLTNVSPETADTLRRRAMIEDAAKLWRSVQHLPSKLRAEHPDDKRASELFRAADIQSLDLLRRQLRTPVFAPPWRKHDSSIDFEGIFARAVAYVISQRSLLLVERRSKSVVSKDALSGRLLLYWPHENLADGAARYSSNGFFDDDNMPPWDTWVGYENYILKSWVPEVLIEQVQSGIDANPEQCVDWAR